MQYPKTANKGTELRPNALKGTTLKIFWKEAPPLPVTKAEVVLSGGYGHRLSTQGKPYYIGIT